MMQIPSNDQQLHNITWLGGPTHHIQKQHIPGYGGHVKGLNSENLYGQTYARLSSKALEDKIQRGYSIDGKAKFQTTSGLTFSNPKGELGSPSSKTLKLNALNVLDHSHSSHSSHSFDVYEIPPIDRIPVVGYQGFRPTYRNIVKKHRESPHPQYQTTSYTDQQIKYLLHHTEQRLDLDRPVPVVGYTGFVQGKRANNAYGRSYRNIMLESKIRYD